MTSTTSPKAGPSASPDSDLLTPEEIEALREQKRQLGREIKEAWARLRARRTTKLDAYLAKKGGGSKR